MPNPLMMQMLGALIGDKAPVPNVDENGDPIDPNKPYKQPGFGTSLFHPQVAQQIGELNNQTYQNNLAAENAAQVWKKQVYDPNPDLQTQFPEWRNAHAQLRGHSEVNPTITNPISIAKTFSDAGGPRITGLDKYQQGVNSYRKNTMSGLMDNPTHEASFENSRLRFGEAQANTGLANEGLRGFGENLALKSNIDRTQTLNPLALKLDEEKLKGEIEAQPWEKREKVNRARIGASLTGQGVEDIPFNINTIKNQDILGSALSRYGGTKPIGGYSVNPSGTVGYGLNEGAMTPEMMKMNALIANPLGMGMSQKIPGVKVAGTGQPLPMKKPEFDPISGEKIKPIGTPIVSNASQLSPTGTTNSIAPILSGIRNPNDIFGSSKSVSSGKGMRDVTGVAKQNRIKEITANLQKANTGRGTFMPRDEYESLYKELQELSK